MKKFYLKNIAFIVISIIIILFSCKKDIQSGSGDGNGSGTGTGNGSVQGVITDLNNSSVSNATVTGGTATATTDANGKFTLTKVQFNADTVVVNVTKDGFFQGTKNFGSTTNTVNNAVIQLIPKPASATIAASSGGNVSISGGGSAVFIGGFVNASNGNNYTGNISVSAIYLNPTDQNFNTAAPGNLKSAGAFNQPGVLQSFGVVAVELNDASGNKLQLESGKTATITFPISSALLGKAPVSIPLWYFDNTKGLWKQEGIAAKQGSNYVGIVNHFSFWSVGDIAGSINLTVSFKDSVNGTPFANKLVTIIRLDSTSGVAGVTNGHTDNTGTVSGVVPVNEPLVMRVYGDCGAMVYSKNIGPFSKDTVLAIIKINNTCPDTTQGDVGDVDIYVAGYEYNGSNGTVAVAKYWKNGQARPITRGYTNSYANSIAVANGYVYIAETSLGAAVWKGNKDNGYVENGETGFFGGSSQQSGANSVAVDGSDSYVAAGYDYNGTVSIAKSWSWGPEPGRGFLSLTDGTQNAMANSIAVVGREIYVAGYEHNGSGVSVAKYWKNGQAIALSDGTKTTYAKSIAVAGGDVYVAGYDSSSSNSNVAKYWKNGVAIPLTDGAHPSTANSIAVVGSDVYVAGSDNNVAKYWKNGQAITLPGGTSASSVAIEGSDVYVAGYGYNGSVSVAKYWKNGVAIPLTDGTYSANATSIFVVKR